MHLLYPCVDLDHIPVFYGLPSTPRLAGAGLCVGACFLFRYDIGVLSLALMSAGLLLFGLIGRRSSNSQLAFISQMIFPFWGAFGLLIAPLALAYVKNGVVDDVIFQLLKYPSENYIKMRRLPFHPLSLRTFFSVYDIVYTPPIAILCFLFLMIDRYLNRFPFKVALGEVYISSLIASFSVGLYFKGIVRVEVAHMIASIIPSLIVLGYVSDRLRPPQKWFGQSALAVPVVGALIFTLASSLHAGEVGDADRSHQSLGRRRGRAKSDFQGPSDARRPSV
jgi:hypothetical protein